MKTDPDFKEWMILTYLETGGIAGELARDILDDSGFPHTANKNEVLGYLRFRYGALTEKYQAAKNIYAEYERLKF